jgi:alkanesulfonate monooxygenase SsuD/methylene tetrahydromethanopterin reductase-like flavin-dependent oxidoreductase (luciferase family)
MVQLSIAVEGLFGLSWPQWKRIALRVDELGFHGLYISDHFTLPEPPGYPSLEAMLALGWAADHTQRVQLGTRVSPISFREPVMLARQAAAIDDLSGGRMSLGVGAGWMEREHEMFGYDLGDIPTRFARFEEGLEVISRLVRGDGPVSFDGRYFRLREAELPQPRATGRPPIAIGGSGPRRSMPLVARFADSWNIESMPPDELAGRSAMLDEMIVAAGRRLEDVERVYNVPVVCWRTPEQLARRLELVRRFGAEWHDSSDEELVSWLRAWPSLVGSPEEVVEQIRRYEAVGISEVELKWTHPDDIEGLELLASEVLPHVA